MTVHEATMAKIQRLPESLAQEVSDFVDFLLMRRDGERWQLWLSFAEAAGLAESEFSDYLSNLQDYEDRLARGEVRW